MKELERLKKKLTEDMYNKPTDQKTLSVPKEALSAALRDSNAQKFNINVVDEVEMGGSGVGGTPTTTAPAPSTSDVKKVDFKEKSTEETDTNTIKLVQAAWEALQRNSTLTNKLNMLKTEKAKIAFIEKLIKQFKIKMMSAMKLKQEVPKLAITASVDGKSTIKEAAEGTPTVGDIRKAFGILKKSQSAEEAKEKLNTVGGTILKIGLGFLPYVGNVISVAGELSDMYKKLNDPKQPKGKTENPYMDLFAIPKGASEMIDDKVEYDYIKYAEQGLESLPDNTPMPDYFEELQKFLSNKYKMKIDQRFDLRRRRVAREEINPRMKKSELVELVQNHDKLKIIERIKVKDLKK